MGVLDGTDTTHLDLLGVCPCYRGRQGYPLQRPDAIDDGSCCEEFSLLDYGQIPRPCIFLNVSNGGQFESPRGTLLGWIIPIDLLRVGPKFLKEGLHKKDDGSSQT